MRSLAVLTSLMAMVNPSPSDLAEAARLEDEARRFTADAIFFHNGHGERIKDATHRHELIKYFDGLARRCARKAEKLRGLA